MEKEPDSATTLAWGWTIEALASFKEVNTTILHGVIDAAPELPDDARKSADEMVALRCLEGLFGPLNDNAEDGPPAQYSKVMFDSSETCEDVLNRIYSETPKSALRAAGPDMRKWDVSPFIAQKRASLRCSLQQLKDAILDGTHPYVDFLAQKSGLFPVNKSDNIPVQNGDHIEYSRRFDRPSSDPQSQKEKGKGSPLLPDDERSLSLADPPSFNLLPSKRSRVDFTSEDEARQLPSCDDDYMNGKKLKQHSAHTLCSGKEVASSHGTELLEDSPERVVQQNERDDTNHLDEYQMTSVENKLAEEQFGPKRAGQCTEESHRGESRIPCFTLPAHTQDGEMHEVISVEKVKDRSELPIQPTTSNSSPAEGSLHNTSTDDSKRDYHVKAMDATFHSGFLPKTVTINPDATFHSGFLPKTVTINPDEEENDMSSDSDVYHNKRIDIATKKNEFISSQCMVSHDSFLSVDRREATVCVKCNEGGQLLSCNISDCPLVVHDECLGSSVRMNDGGDFYCPFCVYSLAISEYFEAKKKAALTKKSLATFIRLGLEHQPIVIKEVLQRKDLGGQSGKARIQDVAKVCEDVDFGNKDNQVTSDGENVNEVTDDHQSPKVVDIEQIIKLSEPLHVANSNHREDEASPLRAAPNVLAGEKDGDGLVDQECQGNTVAELEDGLIATEHKSDNCKILHEDRGSGESETEQEGLQYRTDDNEEEPVYALHIEGSKSSSSDDDDESIISRYSIRFRKKHHQYTCPETPQLRRKKLSWTDEEEETLREGVRKFTSSADRSPTVPWTKILEFGSTVFRKGGRTAIDLKDKWRNLCRSPKSK